jgi:1-acyl-sn-glycerol-3-phosphate acyltransferase
LQNIIADIDTVRQNAQVFKAGGATIVVKPEGVISPTRGNNGVGNGIDPQPPGNPPINDGPGTGPGNPGNNKGGKKKKDAQPRTPST